LRWTSRNAEDLGADRLITFAGLVAEKKASPAADCGLGFRVHRQIAWAKLRARRDSAALATNKLLS
jgi:5-methyltetrahydropteroyltriglutamate--homocysteine methyltransferase